MADDDDDRAALPIASSSAGRGMGEMAPDAQSAATTKKASAEQAQPQTQPQPLPRPPRPRPRRLELFLSSDDGSLAKASLSTIIIAATDALYGDVRDMTAGEIEVTGAVSAAGGAGGMGGRDAQVGEEGADGGPMPTAVPTPTAGALGSPTPAVGAATATAAGSDVKKEKMASLSFARRRHELSSRMARHSKSIGHVAALVSAYGYNVPPSASSTTAAGATARGATAGATAASSSSKFPKRGELAHITSLSDRTFRHVREAWVKADEAQDGLYFQHDLLWKARKHPHDVLGSLAVVGGFGGRDDEEEEDDATMSKSSTSSKGKKRKGKWVDFPTDAALHVDRYQSSIERTLSKKEVTERLRGCVRRKLVLGEVGVMSAASAKSGSSGDDVGGDDSASERRLPWRIILERGGGAVRLVRGEPRAFGIAAATGTATDATQEEEGRGADTAKSMSRNVMYPMEARLSVLSESDAAEWSLLSVRVAVSAKTGEWNHQLNLSKKQMFDLHRLCVRSMTVEEAQTKKLNNMLEKDDTDKKGKEGDSQNDKMQVEVTDAVSSSDGPLAKKPDDGILRRPDGTVVSRPLSCLFDVSHNFATSLHLEVISAQAVSLQKGAWSGVVVSPVHFFERSSSIAGSKDKVKVNANGGDESAALGVVAIHFWSLDDRYGRPALGDLTLNVGDDANRTAKGGEDQPPAADASSVLSMAQSMSAMEKHLFKPDGKGSGRLTLSMRAVAGVGAVVSVSGGDEVIDAITADAGADENTKGGNIDKENVRRRHLQRIQARIVSATSNPFDLSASDALLAATTLCAERRCEAVVSALERGDVDVKASKLPTWLKLVVECGTISVGASISYFGGADAASADKKDKPRYVELFRLECESKSGRFVPTFPREAALLRLLSCNDPRASDLHALSSAAITTRRTPTDNKRHAKFASGEDLTGRTVREAFDGLARSLDLLGERVGVGGSWIDLEKTSASLRARAVEIACRDVHKSLASCSGIAATFGLSALALGVLTGTEASIDLAGGPIKPNPDGVGGDNKRPLSSQLIPVPPIGIILSQQIVQKKEVGSGSDERTMTLLERDIFAVTASIDDEAMTIHCFDVSTQSRKPSIPPTRTYCSHVPLKPAIAGGLECVPLAANTNTETPKAAKRRKIEKKSSTSDDIEGPGGFRPLTDEVRHLAAMIAQVLAEY